VSAEHDYSPHLERLLRQGNLNTPKQRRILELNPTHPLLSKLRREDLVQYEWQESDAGPPRKYYRLTEAGRMQLAALDDYWTGINRTISDIGH